MRQVDFLSGVYNQNGKATSFSKSSTTMQVFELIIVTVLLSATTLGMIPRLGKRKEITYLPVLAAVLIGVHLLIFGYRWQMTLLIIYTPVLFFIYLIQYTYRSKNNFLCGKRLFRITGRIFVSLLFVFSAVFPVLLPVKDLLPTDGPYQVGTTDYLIEDKEREEIFTRDPDDHRRILLSIWYPSEGMKDLPRERYWDREMRTGKAFSRSAEIYPFWYTHLSRVKTNSYRDAPCSLRQESFPVILYSHSYFGLDKENTMLVEMLASHGYVVCCIAHSYENVISLFPESEEVNGDLEYISTLYDSHAEKEEQLYAELTRTKKEEQKIQLVKQILKVDDLSTQLLNERTKDALLVLNELAFINQKAGPLHQKLDRSRIGILGYSFGGATAIEACLSDPRFSAGINLDGLPYGEQFNDATPMKQPFMFVYSEILDDMEQISAELMFNQVDQSAYNLVIKGAQHSNFSDFPYFFRIYERLGYWGPISPRRMLELEKTFIRGFFDQYVKGDGNSLSEVDLNDFPEVSLEMK